MSPMTVEYLHRNNENHLVCVAYPEGTDVYSARVFVGNGSPLQEVPMTPGILSISRYRDGGTTDIETHEGTVHVPSRLGFMASMRTPSFNGEPYARMDIGDLAADLTDEGLVLR